MMDQEVSRYFSALACSVLVLSGAGCGARKKGGDDGGNIRKSEEQTQAPNRGNSPTTPPSKDTGDSPDSGDVNAGDANPSVRNELKTFMRIREATTADGAKANAVLFGIHSSQGLPINEQLNGPAFLTQVTFFKSELNQKTLVGMFQHTQPPYSSDERASLLAECGGSPVVYTEAYPGRLCDGKEHGVVWATSQGDHHQKTTFKFVAYATNEGDCNFTMLATATAEGSGAVAISTTGLDLE